MNSPFLIGKGPSSLSPRQGATGHPLRSHRSRSAWVPPASTRSEPVAPGDEVARGQDVDVEAVCIHVYIYNI